MNTRSSRNGSDTGTSRPRLKWALAGLLTVSISAALYLRYDRPVKLDDDSYEMTVALYAICNYRKEAGLDDLEALLAERNVPRNQESDGVLQIREIIDDARQGNWSMAKKACHQLLDQQTVR